METTRNDLRSEDAPYTLFTGGPAGPLEGV